MVRLKSGGPKMTIKSKSPRLGDGYNCVWFPPSADGGFEGKSESDSFPEEGLMLADTPSKGD